MSIGQDEMSQGANHPAELKVWATPTFSRLPIPDVTQNGAFTCKPVEQPMLYKSS